MSLSRKASRHRALRHPEWQSSMVWPNENCAPRSKASVQGMLGCATSGRKLPGRAKGEQRSGGLQADPLRNSEHRADAEHEGQRDDGRVEPQSGRCELLLASIDLSRRFVSEPPKRFCEPKKSCHTRRGNTNTRASCETHRKRPCVYTGLSGTRGTNWPKQRNLRSGSAGVASGDRKRSRPQPRARESGLASRACRLPGCRGAPLASCTEPSRSDPVGRWRAQREPATQGIQEARGREAQRTEPLAPPSRTWSTS